MSTVNKWAKTKRAGRRTMMTTKTATTTTTTLRLWIAAIALCAIFGVFHGFSKLEFWMVSAMVPNFYPQLGPERAIVRDWNCATVAYDPRHFDQSASKRSHQRQKAAFRLELPGGRYVTGEKPSWSGLGVPGTKPPKNTRQPSNHPKYWETCRKCLNKRPVIVAFPYWWVLIHHQPLYHHSSHHQPLYIYIHMCSSNNWNHKINWPFCIPCFLIIQTMFVYRFVFINLNWPFCIMSTLD